MVVVFVVRVHHPALAHERTVHATGKDPAFHLQEYLSGAKRSRPINRWLRILEAFGLSPSAARKRIRIDWKLTRSAPREARWIQRPARWQRAHPDRWAWFCPAEEQHARALRAQGWTVHQR